MRIAAPFLFLFMTVNCLAIRLTSDADQAFRTYVAAVEDRIEKQHSKTDTYLATLAQSGPQRDELERQLMAGEIKMEAVDGGVRHAGGALLHHWRAAAFVPGATPKDMQALLRDFSRFPKYYGPEVVSSRTLSDDGEAATIALRLQERRVLTIVLDSEYAVRTRTSADDRGYSISRGTHFWQVENPGTARERRRPEGDDDGFLWRLNSYWSFVRARGGLFVECEAVSLTRDVPAGLGWLVVPLISEVPREKLAFTLRATMNELKAQEAKR